jgi:murein DD-endopeptidase MepM/ murein hydrolase activator NlpD
VSEGETVAYEGSTGSGSGPHLDFQVWNPNWDKRRSYYDDGDLVTEGTGVPRAFF